MTIKSYKSGGHFLPDLNMVDRETNSFGKYGRMRKQYLIEHRPVLYSHLLQTGKLFQHLFEIDESCAKRLELLTQQMVKNENVTEALKAADQMAWVRAMNNIRARAEEVVYAELIYS